MPPGLSANFLNIHSIGGFSPSWQPGASFGFRVSPQVSATWGTSLCLCSRSEEGPVLLGLECLYPLEGLLSVVGPALAPAALALG